jgi:hypothetical protein
LNTTEINGHLLFIGDESRDLCNHFITQITNNNEIEQVERFEPYHEFNEERLAAIWDKQQEPDAKPCLIFFNSCINDSTKKSIYLKTVLMNGRQSNIFCVILMSHPVKLPVVLRIQFDYVFTCTDFDGVYDPRKPMNLLYEDYFGSFPTFRDFCDAIAYLEEGEYLCAHNDPVRKCVVVDKCTVCCRTPGCGHFFG